MQTSRRSLLPRTRAPRAQSDCTCGKKSGCSCVRVEPVVATEPATGGETADGRAGGFSPLLFVGLAIASIGGPLALLNFLPGAAGDDGIESAGLVVLLALAVFAAPLTLWLVYSRRVVTPGGLTAFVDAAAGRPVALGHGMSCPLTSGR